MPDDELRELVSRQVYGLSAAEADERRKNSKDDRADEKTRENVARTAVEEALKNDQCSQVFPAEPDTSVCRWYVVFSPGVRSDIELRERVSAHLRLMETDKSIRDSTIAGIQRQGRDQVRDRMFEQQAKERREKEARQAEEQMAVAMKQAALKAERDAATAPNRNRLAGEYQVVLSRLFPSLNYIKVEVTESGKDFALYGTHSFFSKYTFDIGPQGPLVSRWVADHASALRKARIKQVGVRSDSGHAIYYSVP